MGLVVICGRFWGVGKVVGVGLFFLVAFGKECVFFLNFGCYCGFIGLVGFLRIFVLEVRLFFLEI